VARRSEETFKLPREAFRNIFECAPVGIYLTTLPGKLLRVNATAARMFGFASPDEFLAEGTDMGERFFVFPEQRLELVRKALDCRGFVQAEVNYRRKDGSVFLGHLLGRAVRDDHGEAGFVEGFVEDITERKRMETALQQSEARYRTLVERAPLPIGISRNGVVLYVNPKYLELFGCPSAQTQEGRPIREFWAPESWDALETAVRRRSQGLPVPERFEGLAQREDGSRFPVQVASTVVELPDGPATLAFFTDITELKQAEAELKRHEQHLEELVAQRTADLQAANRDLEAFSYSVSHDLRSPLRAIDGYADILLHDFALSLPQPGQKMLDEISRQARRMGQLINDLLEFSHLGSQAMHSVPVDMDALVQEAFAQQSASNSKTRAQLNTHALPPAFADAAMLSVVWNNLLSNALKYSRNRDPALIEVGGSSQGAQNVYFVKDNGAGFDMQHAGKLFGVFQRLHSKEEFEGTGVGLALVERIIQRHGGHIWAEAKVDEGATFSFTLPAQQPPS
jgi:PAS domain S-box-containing protein